MILTWLATYTIRQFQLKQTRLHLESTGHLLIANVQPYWNKPEELQALLRQWNLNHKLRITLLSPDADVWADTHFDPSVLENHADRPELIEARLNEMGSSVRFSSTEQQQNIYFALSLQQNGRFQGYVRLAQSMSEVDQAVVGFQKKILLGWLLLTLITSYFILRLSRTISRPLEHFRTSLQRYAYEETGIFHPDEQPDFPREIEQLAQVMDVMATRLDERTSSLANQRHEEEVILASMNEAVLAVDDQNRIIRINNSAANLLQLDSETCRGTPFQTLVRNEDLNNFLRQTLESLETQVAEIRLFKPNPIYLEAHGSRLRESGGALLGAVIVLNDVTRLKKLENVRREFVGNVTHELRTPITSIKGFIETLLDGGVHDPEDAKRFLNIISRQADRLNTIIDDLLSLSKIEQRDETTSLELIRVPIRTVLETALWSVREKAEDKNITLKLECPPELEANLHSSLFEQAVTNLIDNAVKYSETNKTVRVVAQKEDGSVKIDVEDQGHGIQQIHLPRLFERFYRVDKGRSRAMGGTGLGLSIVKHIVATHGGSISVESELGKGSIFSIRLPGLKPISSQTRNQRSAALPKA